MIYLFFFYYADPPPLVTFLSRARDTVHTYKVRSSRKRCDDEDDDNGGDEIDEDGRAPT